MTGARGSGADQRDVDQRGADRAPVTPAVPRSLKDHVAARRHAIALFREVLSARPYRGYDVIIISSSTPEEARIRQQALDAAFHGVMTDTTPLGGAVCVLSVCDESQGGQLIGQVVTWRRAVDDFRDWASSRGLVDADLNLLLTKGRVRVAIYHNGGKGERASPATQSLGNSRGSQKLVGWVTTGAGVRTELDLMLGIVLQTSLYAGTNRRDAIDTWWGNQVVFGTVSPEEIVRPDAALAKFTIGIDRARLNFKNLFDYGTVRLDANGCVLGFLANKKLARRRPDGEYEPNPDYAAPFSELMAAPDAAYDFGAFSMHRDMHFALMEYWAELRGVMSRVERDGRSEICRDIDPALVQILVPLTQGLDELSTESIHDLPAAGALRASTGTGDWSAVQEAVHRLRAILPGAVLAAMDVAAAGKTEYIDETLAFFLLYRDRPTVFGAGHRRVACINLGAGSHWFTYKRLMDIGNEKFFMLADLAAAPFQIDASGQATHEIDDAEARLTAEDARAFRGIASDAVAEFTLGHRTYALSVAEVRAGVSIVAGEILEGERAGADVFVRGSVIQGGTVLLKGSRVVESVVNASHGRLHVEQSYVESTIVVAAQAARSVLHMVVSLEDIRAEGELVSDVFRPSIEAPGFPKGQARLRVKVGYDPKDDGETGDTTGSYSFREIREMPCDKTANDVIEARCRHAAREKLEAMRIAEETGIRPGAPVRGGAKNAKKKS